VVEVWTGRLQDVETTADIPLEANPVLAIVPFRQITERGFEVVDDAAPLRCLIATGRTTVPVDELLGWLPAEPPPFWPKGFDIDDSAYAEQVKQVIEEEIGRGEGANFVLHRSFQGRVDASARQGVLAWFAALLRHEQGAYWTYAVCADSLAFAGASPERHLTIKSATVTMNPISGTYRHPAEGPTIEGMLSFLTDAKEVDELFMVVDEELKLMSAICPSGGRVIGPYLKEMSRVTHTEYLLEGITEADPREVLRQTMFAPTVTGSPMQNACAVIARREQRPRGYYAGVMALFEPGPGGVWDLDAPILIRTAYVEADGRVSVPAGATLVRHSDPASEVAETRTKAAGILSALGTWPVADAVESGSPAILPQSVLLRPEVARTGAAGSGAADSGAADSGAADSGAAGSGAADSRSAPSGAARAESSPPGVAGPVAGDRRVEATLAYRNERLAQFWLRPQAAGTAPLAGLTTVIVDAEDHFSQMLAHLLRRLGSIVRVASWREYDPETEADLVIPGPGPGDPSGSEPRIEELRRLIRRRLKGRQPFLAVCLSHQILAHELKLDLRKLTRPHQGEQLTDDIFGAPATLGYYNTFTAVAPLEERPGLEIVRRRGTDEVIALRGAHFASLQGHPESALSPDGQGLLARLIPGLGERRPTLT
jgi:phenazine biosynthesis protein phzE